MCCWPGSETVCVVQFQLTSSFVFSGLDKLCHATLNILASETIDNNVVNRIGKGFAMWFCCFQNFILFKN